MVKYQLPSTTLTLDFKDTAFDGAEVKCRTDVSMGFLLRMQRMANSTNDEDAEKSLTEFGDKILIEWNLEDEHIDIPANGTGMLQITASFAQALMSLWAEEVAQPSAPLSPKSSNGITSQTSPEIESMMESPDDLSLGDLSRHN